MRCRSIFGSKASPVTGTGSISVFVATAPIALLTPLPISHEKVVSPAVAKVSCVKCEKPHSRSARLSSQAFLHLRLTLIRRQPFLLAEATRHRPACRVYPVFIPSHSGQSSSSRLRLTSARDHSLPGHGMTARSVFTIFENVLSCIATCAICASSDAVV